MGGSRSHAEREKRRARWRAFVMPRWKYLVREVLDYHEARVLGLRLGVDNDTSVTFAAIARRLHVSEQTAMTIEQRAFAKVRAALHIEGKVE
jgi:DNA-directed RNA polymerase sigma subunit (sigma70/sigma32)